MALVEAALAALARVEDLASRATSDHAAEMMRVVREAAVEGDNLLVADPGRPLPTLFALARSKDGSLKVQTIAIDPATTTLARADGSGALDRYLAVAAAGGQGAAALGSLRDAVGGAASSLSIVRARLALQSSFLAAVLAVEHSAAPPPVSAHLDIAAIRTLALSVGRQLDGTSLSLAARNRRTLEGLFAKAMQDGR